MGNDNREETTIMENTQTIDPYKFWTYKRITVETEWGEESYYEMVTDGSAYTVKIHKLGAWKALRWFMEITHREDSADVGVQTGHFGTFKEAKRFGTNWVHKDIRETA